MKFLNGVDIEAGLLVSGNVGIGTASPGVPLDVTGIIRTTTSFVGNASIVNQVTAATSSGNITFKNNSGADRAIITDAGNFGIGTTSPNAKLEVTGATPTGSRGYGDNANSGQLYITSNAGVGSQLGGRIAFGGIAGNGGGAFSGTRQDSVYGTIEGYKSNTTANNAGGGLSFKTNFNNSGDLIERMNINQVGTVVIGGNVGIGTTSPAQKLHVSGGHILLDNNQEIRQKDSGGTERTVFELDSSNDLNIGGSYAGALKFIGGGSYAEVMRIHDDGNVGIGTTSPGKKLEVVSNTTYDGIQISGSSIPTLGIIDTTNNAKFVAYVRDSDATIGTETNHPLTINTNNTERIRIASSGNVGIGTTSPDAKLSVTSTTINSEDILYLKSGADNVNDYLGIAWELGVGGNGPHSAIRSFAGPSGSDARLGFLTTSDGGTTLTEGLSIAHDGNVGIGTTTPSAKLHVNGSGAIVYAGGTASNNEIVVERTTTSPSKLQLQAFSSNPSIKFTANGNGKLRFLDSSDNERVTFLESGNVGIGTTTPGEKLDVSGNIQVGDGGTGASIKYNSTNRGTIIVNGSEIMRLEAAGNVGIGTTGPTGKLEIQRSQVTTQFDRDSFLRLHPTATTNSGGFTNIMFGTSTTNNYGVAIGGKKGGTGDTSSTNKPEFSVRILNDAIGGTEVLNINTEGNATFAGDVSLADSKKLKFGAGDDLQIYHDGSNSFIRDLGTGNLLIDSNGAELKLRVNTTENALIANSDGSVELYYNNIKKFETATTGVTVTGDADVSSTVLVGNNNSIFAENNLRFKSAGAAFIDHNTVSQSIKFRLSNSSSLDVIPLEITPLYLSSTVDMYFADNDKIRMGAGSDLQIYHDGSNSYINDAGTGDLYIRANNLRLQNADGSGQTINTNNGGNVELFHNNSKKFETTSTGVQVTGNIDGSANIFLQDYIYHSGDGDTYFGFPAANEFKLVAGGSNKFAADANAAYMYYQGSAKFQTTSTGVAITGKISGLTAGTANTDAVNVQQLNNATTGTLIYKGTWSAAPTTTSVLDGAVSSAGTIVIDAVNPGISVGATVTGTGISGTVTVSNIAADGITIAISSSQTIADGTTLTFTTVGGTPDLSQASRKVTGHYYICETAGAVTPNGAGTTPNEWAVGDWATFSDLTTDAWQKIDNSSVLSGAGTGGKVPVWSGTGTSVTLADAPITVSGNNVTFAGNITFGDSHTIGDDGDDNLVIASSASENIIIDSADDIVLDAAGNDVLFKDAGTHIGTINMSSSNLTIESSVSDKDIIFKGRDGTSTITALTLDMSNGGSATFVDDIDFGGKITQTGTGTNTFAGTVNIVGTNATGQESVLLRGITSNGGDLLGSIRTANTGGYNQEMRFYTSNANGTTDEDLTLTLKPDQSATFAGDVTTAGRATFTDDVTIDNSSPELYLTPDSAKYSWMIAAQENVDQHFEITPSTTVGGSTFNAPALKINGADNAATFAGNVTLNGDGKLLKFTPTSYDDVELGIDSNGFVIYNTTDARYDLKISGTGNATFAGDVTVGDDLFLADSGIINLGTDNDLTLFHDGADAVIRNNTGHLYVDNLAGDKDIYFRGKDGTSTITALTLDMSEGGKASFVGDVSLPDNKKLILGAGDDLQIFHDGSHSRIKDAGTGSLTINATDFIVNNSADTKNMIIAVDGGATTLFCDGAGKIATTSTGVSVTGNGIFTGYVNTTLVFGTTDLNLGYAGGTSGIFIKGSTALAGNVGIGTTAPKSKLQVAGGIQMAGDTAAASADKVGTMRYRTGTEHVEVNGTNIITNGDFAADSNWTKVGDVAIASGVATFDDSGSNANSYLQQDALTATKKYLITLDVKRYAAGRIQILAGTDVYSVNISQGVGSYSIYTSAVGSAVLRIKRDGSYANFDFDIDNVSAIEVTAEDASYADMCMQTGASTYEWVNIVRNTY